VQCKIGRLKKIQQEITAILTKGKRFSSIRFSQFFSYFVVFCLQLKQVFDPFATTKTTALRKSLSLMKRTHTHTHTFVVVVALIRELQRNACGREMER